MRRPRYMRTVYHKQTGMTDIYIAWWGIPVLLWEGLARAPLWRRLRYTALGTLWVWAKWGTLCARPVAK